MMMHTSSVRTVPDSRAAPPRPEVAAADRAEALRLPLDTRFELEDRITPVQQAFLDAHGFLVFAQALSRREIDRVFDEIDAIERRWLDEGRTHVNGIPIFAGELAGGRRFVQRFPFTSLFSDYMRSLVRDPRFDPVRSLIGDSTRVGDDEKDGLVFNRNLNVEGSAYKDLGWHTDGLRDLFMIHDEPPHFRLPGPMLNVGLHFDRVRREDGGLRLIPGSHEQGFLSMLARKPYFVWHRPDPAEIAVETEPGDLTVHDGRTWHRVQRSPHTGERSLRRTMYVPYLTDAYSPKTEQSRTPGYHRLGVLIRRAKRALGR